jgi:large subunit ribosomal protein L21
MYAILSHGGRQYRVSAGDRLVVDRLDAQVGSVVALEPVLLTGGDGKTALGKDLDGLRVAVTVVAHRRGEKLRIFKYKAKKRSRKMAGYRSELTELRVESILAKGAALPSAPSPAESRPRRRTAPEATIAPAQTAKAAKAAPASKPTTARATGAAPKAGATKSAPPAAAKAATGTTVAAKPKTPSAAKTTTTTKAKATPKRASKGRAAKGEEKGDGA